MSAIVPLTTHQMSSLECCGWWQGLPAQSECEAPLQVVTIDAVEDVPGSNETALMQAVTMHPVGIGLCVGPWIKEWRAYTGGILTVPGIKHHHTPAQCALMCCNCLRV